MADDNKAKGLPLRLCIYTDANFAAATNAHKSMSATTDQVNGMTASRRCKKQSSATLSTTEAAYVAVKVGAQGLARPKDLLGNLGISLKLASASAPRMKELSGKVELVDEA
ncbi:hypothetical protein PInf_005206 [Phytophthora infestans]|nr:hypothetical protein PInf_005206 [Phytophthora infestans]